MPGPLSGYIALLRAVNLGPVNKIGMADFRALLGSLGCEDVRTILQTGNAVFRCDAARGAQLEPRLEREIAARLRVKTAVFVRDADELAAVVARNPFAREANKNPSHLVVSFLRERAEPDAVKALQAAIAGPELVRADGRHLYIVYPEGIGRSALTGALFARHIPGLATARNWSTVVKLSEALAS
jgi:uncharacterized protein (DUF1697 family)